MWFLIYTVLYYSIYYNICALQYLTLVGTCTWYSTTTTRVKTWHHRRSKSFQLVGFCWQSLFLYPTKHIQYHIHNNMIHFSSCTRPGSCKPVQVWFWRWRRTTTCSNFLGVDCDETWCQARDILFFVVVAVWKPKTEFKLVWSAPCHG